MSSRHSAQSTPIGQANSADDQIIDHQAEFCRLGCILLRIFIAALQSETCQIVGRRFANFARGAYYPESGYADLHLVAGLSNRTISGVRRQVQRLNLPSKSPGDAKCFKVLNFIDHAPENTHKAREAKDGAE